MRVAFYAPLKAPDHPVPSGDRAIARLLLAALERAGATRGWEVDVASRFRSFDGAGDADRQARLREIGARIADRLLRRYREAPAGRRPALWFTYHLYHKAPDWIGPVVSERLGIPYLVAEASHAAKQRGGRWSIGHEAAAEAIRHADAILALNRDDVAGVRQVARDPSRVIVFSPFLGPRGVASDESRLDRDPGLAEGEESPGPSRRVLPPVTAGASAAPGRAGARASVARRLGVPDDEPWLLCVAMMRGGRKLASFEVLADALARPGLASAPWHLLVAGEGRARREVEAAFAGRLPAGRVTFTGRVEGELLAGLYAGADLFVWPAVGEPMGMAMLEAQGHGLPVVSARTRGVPDLVCDEETGVLVPEGDSGAFADAVRALLRAPARRRRMGDAARARVAREHGFERASERIGDLVETLVRRRSPDGSGPPDAPAEAAERLGAGTRADACRRSVIELLFLRHGPTEWNEAGRIQGRRDIPLSSGACAALSARRVPGAFGAGCRWVSSPLRRARETAQALGAEEIEIEPRITEMDWGEWEGTSLHALREALGEAMRVNEERGLDFETPAGDSPRRVQARLRPWLAEIAEERRPVVAVSHKGVGRALLALAIGWDMKAKAPVRLRWEHVHRFEVSRSGEPRLVEPNVELVPRDFG